MNHEFYTDSQPSPSRKKRARIRLHSRTSLITTALLALGTQWASAACGSSSRQSFPNAPAAQPQLLLQGLLKLADGQAGQGLFPCIRLSLPLP
jgi:hypothetical protein